MQADVACEDPVLNNFGSDVTAERNMHVEDGPRFNGRGKSGMQLESR